MAANFKLLHVRSVEKVSSRNEDMDEIPFGSIGTILIALLVPQSDYSNWQHLNFLKLYILDIVWMVVMFLYKLWYILQGDSWWLTKSLSSILGLEYELGEVYFFKWQFNILILCLQKLGTHGRIRSSLARTHWNLKVHI